MPVVDYSTSVGQVRLLIPDTGDVFVFADDAIGAFLTLEAGNVRLAAAQALDVLASNEAMVSKMIRTQDLQTNGPAVAAELRQRAVSLREQASAVGEETFGLEIVDYNRTGWELSARWGIGG